MDPGGFAGFGVFICFDGVNKFHLKNALEHPTIMLILIQHDVPVGEVLSFLEFVPCIIIVKTK